MHLIDTTTRLPRLLAMPPTTPTVVVVDDDISVRESLELLIQNEGWQPALFESAQEFLARLPTVVPSCLILDVNLPDLSCLDLQQRISVEKSSIPIIFITGWRNRTRVSKKPSICSVPSSSPMEPRCWRIHIPARFTFSWKMATSAPAAGIR
jgi:CheY-like chemotaxis protein